MAFEKTDRQLNTDDSYGIAWSDYEKGTERPVRPGKGSESSTRKRAGKGRSLLLALSLILVCGSFLLMHFDMRRDVRHGVCRCEDGRMMEIPAAPDRDKISRTAEGISRLAGAHPDIDQYMMLIPSAACVQPDYLPAGLKIRDQAADLNMIRGAMPAQVTWIDLLTFFRAHAGEKLYFATDSFLTGWGSRYASNTAIEGMGGEVPEGRDECYLLSDRFCGNLAKDGKPVQRLLRPKRERLEIYVPENEARCYRIDGLGGKNYASLYDSSALETENPYDVFFGGDRPLTEIRSVAVNGEILFVVGGREADSVVPRFVSSYEKIILIHPEKCKYTMEKLIKTYQPTKILYLYGANAFMRDRTLLHFLGER